MTMMIHQHHQSRGANIRTQQYENDGSPTIQIPLHYKYEMSHQAREDYNHSPMLQTDGRPYYQSPMLQSCQLQSCQDHSRSNLTIHTLNLMIERMPSEYRRPRQFTNSRKSFPTGAVWPPFSRYSDS